MAHNQFNHSPEQHVASTAKSTDQGVMASITDGMSHVMDDVHSAWNHVTLHASTAPMSEFAKEEPAAGVSKDGLDFGHADAALAGGSIYAMNSGNKPDAAKLKGIQAADNSLDQFLAA